jgi:hypothetical protein
MEALQLKTLTLSRNLLNPMTLPGMGRSIEVSGLSSPENLEIRSEWQKGELYIEFDDEPGNGHRAINLWPDPHDISRLTLFIK